MTDYTMEKALDEAQRMLDGRFPEADPSAVVQLATFLYGVHARDEFMRRRDDDTAAPPLGGGLTG